MPKLYPHQERAAAILQNAENAYLAFRMRRGKTPTVITAAARAGHKRILFVCKASARWTIARQFEQWAPDFRLQIVRTLADKIDPKANVVICSYNAVRDSAIKAQLMRVWWDLQIYDEAHGLKNRESAQTKAVFGALCKGGNDALVARAHHVWCLSGTPMTAGPADLFPVLRALRPDLIAERSYWNFVKHFCHTYNNGFGIQIGGVKRPEIFNREILDQFMIREPDARALDGLKTYGEIVIDPPKIKGCLDVLRSEAHKMVEAHLADGNDLSDLAGPPIATLRANIAHIKAVALVETLADELEADPDRKIVVFGGHTEALKHIAGEFNNLSALAIGGQTPKQRQAAIDRFQTDPAVRLFVANYHAAGDSISLDAADDIMFLEQDWAPAVNEQAAMRCDSMQNPDKSVLVRTVHLRNSVDDDVQRILARKNRVIAQIMEADHVNET